MTRKDYVKFAKMFAQIDDGQPTAVTVSSAIGHERMLDIIKFKVADIFAADNPRFDYDRFDRACRGI